MAGNPFGSDAMAAGYATSRPPVHPRVIEMVRAHLGGRRARRALDIGCGAGLSTRALQALADRCLGLEPVEAMLRWAGAIAPEAEFVAGTAEALPLRDRSMDLMTAAGSLNYVRLERFFPEAARVLTPGGVLVVYDFSPGSSLRHTTRLDEWFQEFYRRYPPPAGEERPLSPEILAELDTGFRVRSADRFEIGIALRPEFYLDYVLTETNVAAAVRRQAALSEIRSWCAETLRTIWEGRVQEVLFRGYFACLVPAGGDGADQGETQDPGQGIIASGGG